MGNCCKPASSMEWGGEDWDSLMSSENTVRKTRNSSMKKVFDESHHHQGLLSLGKKEKKEKVLGALRGSCDANGKVTIKISKKELVELLGGIEENQNNEINNNNNNNKKKQLIGRPTNTTGSSAEQVLLRLIKAKERANKYHHDSNHGPWKPVLQTIPEVN